MDFSLYLDGRLQLSTVDVRFCERLPIRAFEIEKTMSDCTSHKSPGLPSLPYEFYVLVPDLFDNNFQCS